MHRKLSSGNKLSLVIAILLLGALGWVILSPGKSLSPNCITAIPAKGKWDSRWGLIDAQGHFLVKNRWENPPSVVMNGVFCVNYGSDDAPKYTLFRNVLDPQPISTLQGLYSCGFMSEGVVPAVFPEGRIKYYDIDGVEQFSLEPVDGREITGVSPYFIGGLAVINTSDDMMGAIDPTGAMVIEPKYKSVMRGGNGYCVAGGDGHFSLFDKDHNQVCDFDNCIYPPLIIGDRVLLKRDIEDLHCDAFYEISSGEIIDVDPQWEVTAFNDTYYVVYDKNNGGVQTKLNTGERINNSVSYLMPNEYLLIPVEEGEQKRVEIRDKDYKLTNTLSAKVTHIFGIDQGELLIRADAVDTPFEFIDYDDEDSNKVRFTYSDGYGFDVDGIAELRLFSPHMVNSDYFAADIIADALLSPINSENADYGEYDMYEPITKYAPQSYSPSSYIYSSSMTLPAFSVAGCELTPTLYTNRTIAHRPISDDDFGYWSYPTYGEPEFDSSALINKIQIKIEFNLPTERRNRLKQACERWFADHGYTTVESALYGIEGFSIDNVDVAFSITERDYDTYNYIMLTLTPRYEIEVPAEIIDYEVVDSEL